MKTKKLIAGILSAVTFASVSVSAIASAADNFSVKISSAEVEAGEEFNLTMDLAGIPSAGINGCEFGISFDPSVVTVTSVELGKLAQDVTSAEEGLPSPLEFNIESNVISLMYALGTTDSSLYLTGSGTFLNIKGEVNSSAKAGASSEFKVVPVDRAVTPGSSTSNTDIVFGYMSEDDKITKYDPTFESGTVTVKAAAVVTDPSDKPTEPTGEGTTTKKTTASQKPDDPTQPTSNNNPDETTTKKTTAKPDPSGEDETTTKKTTASSKDPDATEDIPKGTKYGDVNLDKSVNVADCVALNMYLLNSEKNALKPEGKANADCKRDNKIDMTDSTILMNYVAELITIDQLGK